MQLWNKFENNSHLPVSSREFHICTIHTSTATKLEQFECNCGINLRTTPTYLSLPGSSIWDWQLMICYVMGGNDTYNITADESHVTYLSLPGSSTWDWLPMICCVMGGNNTYNITADVSHVACLSLPGTSIWDWLPMICCAMGGNNCSEV